MLTIIFAILGVIIGWYVINGIRKKFDKSVDDFFDKPAVSSSIDKFEKVFGPIIGLVGVGFLFYIMFFK